MSRRKDRPRPRLLRIRQAPALSLSGPAAAEFRPCLTGQLRTGERNVPLRTGMPRSDGDRNRRYTGGPGRHPAGREPGQHPRQHRKQHRSQPDLPRRTGRPDHAADLALARPAGPGPRPVPAGPPRAVAGRAGQLVGRRLAGARAGLTAGLVFAVVPSVSRFAQEIRFYALAVLVATLATLLLLRALERPSWPRLAAYAACLALLGCVELVALSVVAGHIAGAVLRTW